MSTHTKCEGATWPSVSCRATRLRWVREILNEEGIQCGTTFDSIAFALLKAAANDFGTEKDARIACFKAAIILERL